jgi:outer membrane protein, adhesin transport system
MSAKEVEQTLALSIAQSLYLTINAHGKILVYQDFLSVMWQSKEMMLRRIEQGVSPESDLMLVESRLATLKTDLNLATVAQRKALATLAQYMARDVKLDEFMGILPQKKCSIQFDKYQELGNFIDESLKVSPSAEKYDYQIATQKKEIDLKEASLYPSIYAQVTREKQTGYQNETVGKVVVEMNFGAGLSTFSNLEATKVNVRGLEDDKNNYLLELTQKLESEKIEYEQALQRYENYVVSVDNAKETTESYERLFKVGKKSWIDVLNSQREWMNTEIALTDAQSYLLIAPFKFKIYANQLIRN